MIRHFDDDDDEEVTMFDKTSLLKSPSSRPPSKCQKLVKTVFLCAGFFGMGLAIAIPGPTLNYLEQQNNVSKEHISYIYPARSLGYLLGSIVSGILFDKCSSKDKLLTALGLIITAVGLTLAPWVQSLSLLCICMSVSGIAMGFLDTGGNVMCLKIWNKDSGPYLQSLHFSFGVGALVAPLIAAPFLTTVPSEFATVLNATTTPTLNPIIGVEHFVNKRQYLVVEDNTSDPILNMSHTVSSTVPDSPIATTSSMNSTMFLNLSSITTESNSGLMNGSLTSTTALIVKKPVHSGSSLSENLGDRSGDDLGEQIEDLKQKLKIPASTEMSDGNSTIPITPDPGITTEATSNFSKVITTLEANSTTNDSTTSVTLEAMSISSNKSLFSEATPSKIAPLMTTDGAQSVSTSPETSPAIVTTALTTTELLETTATFTITVTNTATQDQTTLPVVTTVSTTQTIPNSPTSSLEATSTTNPVTAKTSQIVTKPVGSEIPPSLVTASTSFEQHKENTSESSRTPTPNVRYAYLIIGVVLVICAISFCSMECCGSEDSKDSRADSNLNVDKEPETEHSTGFKVKIMIGAFLFFMLYVGTEISFGQFISSFGQAAYSLTEKEGAFLTSIFWTAFTIGRGLSIPLSKCLSPTAQIIFSLILSLTSAIGLVVTTLMMISVHVLWLLTALCGIGCAAIFPSGVLWIEQHIKVSAKMATVFVVGSSFGEMWIPAVVGYYFVQLGPISLMYMTLGCIIGCAFIFFAMQCVAKTPKSHYKLVSTIKPSETLEMVDLDFSDSETDTEPIIPRSNGSTKSYLK